jgi:hypothetical protein
VEVHPETLLQASNQWSALLDTSSLPAPLQLPVYTDPASAAVATAMSPWPAIHESMTAKRNAAADALVSSNHKTSVSFIATDDRNAHNISSSVRPPLV